MVKLIACDLDDTLLNDELAVSQENIEAIAQAQERGLIFTFATGRMYASALPFAKQLDLPPELPLICYNGALIKRVSGETIYEAPLSFDLALDMVRYCTSQGWTTNVYYKDELYVSEVNSDVEYYLTIADVPVHEVGDLVKFLEDGQKQLSKVLVVSPQGQHAETLALLEERYSDSAYVLQSKNRMVELTSLHANKAIALKWLTEKMGIKMEEVLAIGDSNNDVDMLREAGIGVAMGNAVSDAKDAADHITTSNNEGGVARAIRDFTLS